MGLRAHFAATAALMAAFACSGATLQASPLQDWGDRTYDPNTGLEWLDMGYANYVSHVDVQANLLGPGQRLEGYRYATVAEVEALFVNAGITNFSHHGADAHIAALVALLGPTFGPAPAPNIGLGGMTADEYPLDTSFVYYVVLRSGSDDFGGSFAGVAGVVGKAQVLPADSIGSFLVRQYQPAEDVVVETPLPPALGLFCLGLGLMRLLYGCVRRTRAPSAGAIRSGRMIMVA